MTAPAIPESYRDAVVAHIMIDGASDAIAFYRKAFGATELFRLDGPNGTVAHAEIRVQSSVLMLGDADGPVFTAPTAAGATVALHVFVDDVDALVHRAAEAGAEVLQPPADQFHGHRTAILRDPFGHVWVFLTHLADLSPEELVRAHGAAGGGR